MPLGALDYLHIAHAFHTVIIDDIPVSTRDRRDVARRFINLIDTLYDNGVCLIASAEAEPAELYPEGDGADAFERTASRLMEMRSEAYLKSRHGRRSRTLRRSAMTQSGSKVSEGPPSLGRLLADAEGPAGAPLMRRSAGRAGRDAGAGEARAVRAAPVEQRRALDVARLQARLALVVAVGHELARRARVVEADGVADLVRDRVAQVVDVEVAVEADLPGLARVQADERARDHLAAPAPRASARRW